MPTTPPNASHDDAQSAPYQADPLSLTAWKEALRRLDDSRESFPGEHWLAFGAGALLLARGGRGVFGRAVGIAAGALLIGRALTGRDGLLTRVQTRLAEGVPHDESARAWNAADASRVEDDSTLAASAVQPAAIHPDQAELVATALPAAQVASVEPPSR